MHVSLAAICTLSNYKKGKKRLNYHKLLIALGSYSMVRKSSEEGKKRGFETMEGINSEEIQDNLI